MRITFDITAAKQVPFFQPMIRRLHAEGHDVSLTTRDWHELNLVRKHFRMRATSLGRHGGPTLLGKLLSSSARAHLLAGHFARHRPDVVVGLMNSESARAAFGLQIPFVSFADIPEARASARLTLPLASKVCAPWIISRRELLQHGVSSQDVFHYRSLDPVLWLKERPVDTAYVNRLGLDPERPVIVCRETEWQSAYVATDIVGTVMRQLRRRHPRWQFVNIPRYAPHPFFDVPSLLAKAGVLIGGGAGRCASKVPTTARR